MYSKVIPAIGSTAHNERRSTTVHSRLPFIYDERLQSIFGILYLAFTVYCSYCFVRMVTVYTTNDLWWPQFSTSGAHLFLVDTFNSILNTCVYSSGSIPIDIAAIENGNWNDYASVNTTLSMSTVYPRHIMYSTLTTIESAIVGLHALNGKQAAIMLAQYCWVDFERRWEMAHTLQRQRRCDARYKPNAAMYMEGMLRNINWTDWIANQGDVDGEFGISIMATLLTIDDGRQWLVTVQNAYVSIDKEVQYWRSKGLEYYVLQYQNNNQVGLVETIAIETAWGRTERITIKSIPYTSRHFIWTTGFMYWALTNDMWFSQYFNQSLIRGNSNYGFFFQNATLQTIYNYPPNPVIDIMETYIGPYMSVDLLFVPLPPSWIQFYELVHSFFITTLHQYPHLYLMYRGELEDFIVTTWPFQWQNRNYMYYGGSPLCFNGKPQSFVQPSFGFDDDCGAQRPASSTLRKKHVLFATIISMVTTIARDAMAIPEGRGGSDWWELANCTVSTPFCYRSTKPAFQLATAMLKENFNWVQNISAMLKQSLNDLLLLKIELIQIAADNSNPSYLFLLRHSLGHDTNGNVSADIFNMVCLLDWIVGVREVVSFQGDQGTLNLISYQYELASFSPKYTDIPSTMGSYFLYGTIYTLNSLLCIAVLIAVYSIATATVPHLQSLLYFNRIGGAVWVGCPLLFLRGLTAAAILSTSHVQFHHQVEWELNRLQLTKRSLFDSVLIAGEYTWISYTLTDFALATETDFAKLYAMSSSSCSFFVALLLEIFVPIPISGSVQRSCYSNNMDYQLYCENGALKIGSVTRFQILLVTSVTSFLISFSVARAISKTVLTKRQKCVSHLVPSAGIEYLTLQRDDSTTTDTQIDIAGGILCGLLPIPTRHGYCILDIKLWRIFTSTMASSRRLFLKPFHVVDSTTNVVDLHGEPMATLKYRSPFLTLTIIGLHFKYTSSTSFNRHPNVSEGDGECNSKRSMTIPSLNPASNRRSKCYKLWMQIHSTWYRVRALIGMVYIVSTLIGSTLFLSSCNISLANDMLWSNFDITTTHVFIANVINNNLLLYPSTTDQWTLNRMEYASDHNYASQDVAVVAFSAAYTRHYAHRHRTNLVTIVQAIQRMNPCMIPLLSTQFCWLDFNREWEVAHTSRRQLRCRYGNNSSSNAAVYLESLLRNTNYSAFQQCWGYAFDIAFTTYLTTTSSSTDWVQQVQYAGLTAQREVEYWVSKGITSFDFQWQNYKTVGITDLYTIENALQLQYPFTLKNIAAKLHYQSATSTKMYWSFAGDLWSIAATDSICFNSSLLRASSNYAFRNTTIQSVLIHNGSLPSPFDITMTAFEALIGPYGDIDIRYVTFTETLAEFCKVVAELNANVLYRNENSAQDLYFAIPLSIAIFSTPSEWISNDIYFIGGNVFCGAQPATASTLGMYTTFEFTASCLSPQTELLNLRRQAIVFAWTAMVLLSVDIATEVAQICSNSDDIVSCNNFVRDTMAYLDEHVAPLVRDDLNIEQLACISQREIESRSIEYFQYASDVNGSSPQSRVLHAPLLSNATKARFVDWYNMYDWVDGVKEVITIEGDKSAITIIGGYYQEQALSPNEAELPKNVAYFVLQVTKYITSIQILIATLAFVYLLRNNAHCEGFNMFEINRVGGIVWVGRPLLFLRGMVAICLLSTSQLHLQLNSQMYALESTPEPLFRVILMAGELCWLTYIINDLASTVTGTITMAYSSINSILLWIMSGLLGVVNPVHHSLRIDPICEYQELDFQLHCTSATLTIGSYQRLLTLILCSIVLFLTSYLFVYFVLQRYMNVPAKLPTSSLLSSSARLFFDYSNWVCQGTVYLDKASAVINGLLIWKHVRSLVVLDIKSWRVSSIENAATNNVPETLRYALPLVDS